MKFQIYISKNVKKIGVLLLVLSVFVSSCSKEEHNIGTGNAVLKVSLQGVDFGEEQSPLKMASVNGKSMALETVQETSVPFDDDYTIVAQLIAESPVTFRKEALIASASTAGVRSPVAVAAPADPVALPNGTKYTVVAYNSSGAYVHNVIYTVGSETTEGFVLDGGATYTFVAYSIGTTDPPPQVATNRTLSTSDLSTDGHKHFMWYKKTITLTSGVNNLDIVLKHRFSQITTVINASAIGSITAIEAKIAPHRLSATIKLSDGSVTYGTASSRPVVFPTTLNLSTVTSTPTIVCANTTTGTYTISSMTIAGTKKTGIVLPNLKITPGVRYRLVLTLTPSTGGDGDGEGGITIGNLTWAPGNLIYTGAYPTGTYGFAANQGVFAGTNVWAFNSKVPNGYINTDWPGDPAATGVIGDPCALVSSEWRTPTRSDIAALIGGAYVQASTYSKYGASTSTIFGKYFGTTTAPTTDASKDNFVFLPLDPVPDKSKYWTKTAVATGGTAYVLKLQTWDLTTNNAESNRSFFPIRCVKN